MAHHVRSIILTGNGTNCEMEMAHACRLAGSDVVDIVYVSELLAGRKRLDDYDFLNLPGGFLDGDDLGAAKAGAHRIMNASIRGTEEKVSGQLARFIRDGKLILGVCNGFQLMVKLGLLPAFDGDYATQRVTLTFNDSGRFEDRWVYLWVNPRSRCIFTKGIEELYFPVRHGEGKFIARDSEVLKRLHAQQQVVVQYRSGESGEPAMEYPANPNGSIDAIAGICDESGRLFGLMPHPEAYLHYTNHPRWTRETLPEEGMGLLIFRRAIEFIRNNL